MKKYFLGGMNTNLKMVNLVDKCFSYLELLQERIGDIEEIFEGITDMTQLEGVEIREDMDEAIGSFEDFYKDLSSLIEDIKETIKDINNIE